MTSDNNTLVLVGGTGGLGAEVAQGLVTSEGFDKRVALVRATSFGRSNREAAQPRMDDRKS
jgi:NAD(P)-dependent dehydrogenase (short-subunit alcohol dehydrogenase family)